MASTAATIERVSAPLQLAPADQAGVGGELDHDGGHPAAAHAGADLGVGVRHVDRYRLHPVIRIGIVPGRTLDSAITG